MTDEAKRAIEDLTEALPMLPEAYRKKCTLETATIRLAIAAIEQNEAVREYCGYCVPPCYGHEDYKERMAEYTMAENILAILEGKRA